MMLFSLGRSASRGQLTSGALPSSSSAWIRVRKKPLNSGTEFQMSPKRRARSSLCRYGASSAACFQ